MLTVCLCLGDQADDGFGLKPNKRGIMSIEGNVFLYSNCRLPFVVCAQMKTNSRFPFAANKQKLAVSASRLQKTNGSCHFPLAEFRKHGDIETLRHGVGGVRRKTEAQAIFHKPSAVSLLCKRKVVAVC